MAIFNIESNNISSHTQQCSVQEVSYHFLWSIQIGLFSLAMKTSCDHLLRSRVMRTSSVDEMMHTSYPGPPVLSSGLASFCLQSTVLWFTNDVGSPSAYTE